MMYMAKKGKCGMERNVESNKSAAYWAIKWVSEGRSPAFFFIQYFTGRFAAAAAISSAGVVLSQPVVRTTPSNG